MKFQTWGLSGTLATQDPEDLEFATARLWHWIGAIDDACNRFRADSEIRRVEEQSLGHAVAVGPLLFEALEVACAVSVQTAGIVDPTIGSALRAWLRP